MKRKLFIICILGGILSFKIKSISSTNQGHIIPPFNVQKRTLTLHPLAPLAPEESLYIQRILENNRNTVATNTNPTIPVDEFNALDEALKKISAHVSKLTTENKLIFLKKIAKAITWIEYNDPFFSTSKQGKTLLEGISFLYFNTFRHIKDLKTKNGDLKTLNYLLQLLDSVPNLVTYTHTSICLFREIGKLLRYLQDSIQLQNRHYYALTKLNRLPLNRLDPSIAEKLNQIKRIIEEFIRRTNPSDFDLIALSDRCLAVLHAKLENNSSNGTGLISKL